MDPTSTAIVLATCVFLLLGLGAAMTMSSKMPGLRSL